MDPPMTCAQKLLLSPLDKQPPQGSTVNSLPPCVVPKVGQIHWTWGTATEKTLFKKRAHLSRGHAFPTSESGHAFLCILVPFPITLSGAKGGSGPRHVIVMESHTEADNDAFYYPKGRFWLEGDGGPPPGRLLPLRLRSARGHPSTPPGGQLE